MKVYINDKEIDFALPTSLAEAIASQGIKPQGIATAVNGTVIPATQRKETKLSEGDKIVIIKAFYGG